MIAIGNLTVQESWTEYAAEVEPGLIISCDDRSEAEVIVDRNAGAKLLTRHCYLTEWCDG